MSKRTTYLLAAALIAAVMPSGPALAQRAGAVISDELRQKCQAQIRAAGIRRGWGGTSAEKHRMAVFRQCVANGGRL